eukprot:jgi/Chrzof1/5910/Cz16g20110.t1
MCCVHHLLSGINGCYYYQATSTDYFLKISDKFNVPLLALLSNNTDVVEDLDEPLAGKRLLVCNPSFPQRNASCPDQAAQRVQSLAG